MKLKLNVQARLSERNVVELVQKLKELGLLGDGLLHTINGREYLTEDHLRKQILQAVDAAGGRIALVPDPSVLKHIILQLLASDPTAC